MNDSTTAPQHIIYQYPSRSVNLWTYWVNEPRLQESVEPNHCSKVAAKLPKVGGGDRTRTDNNLLAKQALYH